MASVVHRGVEGRELQDGSAGRLIRCYRHAWHHGWNECRSTVTGANGTTGTVRTAADTGANGAATGSVTASGDQTAASTGALTKSEYGQLAQTGIGISLACAAILLLAGLAYAMKTFVQYKRETSED